MAEQTELFLVYLCPGCLGVFDGPGVCDDCGVGLTENIVKVAQLHGGIEVWDWMATAGMKREGRYRC